MMRKVLGFSVLVAAIVACGSTAGSSSSSDGGSAAPVCPATAPAGGSCSDDSLVCNYDCSNGGPSTVHCIKGTWAAERINMSCIDGGALDAGPPPADAPFACGQTTCGTTQYCVVPCCGGAAPLCETSLLDAGTCPPGFHTAQCQQGPGCEANPCTPDPPFCVDSPSDPKANGCGQYDKGRTLSCLCA